LMEELRDVVLLGFTLCVSASRGHVTLSFSFGEGVEDNTYCHPQKADEKREVISFGWISVIDTGKELNDLSHGRHEDGCAVIMIRGPIRSSIGPIGI